MNVSPTRPPHTHILVVGDAQQDFELIENQLLHGGMQFSSKRIDTHDELARELDARPPSIVLCDHGNARLDSFSVLEQVRAHSATTPFIVVTGSLDEAQLANVVE